MRNDRGTHFKSLRARLMLMIGAMSLVICLMLGSGMYIISSQILHEKIDESLIQLAAEGSQIIEKEVAGRLDVIKIQGLNKQCM